MNGKIVADNEAELHVTLNGDAAAALGISARDEVRRAEITPEGAMLIVGERRFVLEKVRSVD